jgi:hypothetical protein
VTERPDVIDRCQALADGLLIRMNRLAKDLQELVERRKAERQEAESEAPVLYAVGQNRTGSGLRENGRDPRGTISRSGYPNPEALAVRRAPFMTA